MQACKELAKHLLFFLLDHARIGLVVLSSSLTLVFVVNIYMLAAVVLVHC